MDVAVQTQTCAHTQSGAHSSESEPVWPGQHDAEYGYGHVIMHPHMQWSISVMPPGTSASLVTSDQIEPAIQ